MLQSHVFIYMCVTYRLKTVLMTLRFILIIFSHLLHICFVFLWSCNTDRDVIFKAMCKCLV